LALIQGQRQTDRWGGQTSRYASRAGPPY